jgi:ketosteroid isomerase-like protein
MSDEQQISRLRDLYAETFDARDAAAFVRLFADDAALVLPGGKALTGHDRLVRLIESVPANGGRHIPIAADIVIDGDSARCCGPYRMELGDSTQTGTYDDAFVRTADGWRFARREIIPGS